MDRATRRVCINYDRRPNHPFCHVVQELLSLSTIMPTSERFCSSWPDQKCNQWTFPTGPHKVGFQCSGAIVRSAYVAMGHNRSSPPSATRTLSNKGTPTMVFSREEGHLRRLKYFPPTIAIVTAPLIPCRLKVWRKCASKVRRDPASIF